MSCRNNKGGFTLVEMIVVIAIISILTAIAVPTMGKLGMFGRDPLNVAARQTLVMLKAARIYAGTHNVDTAVVYSIGLHQGPQTIGAGTAENIRVIDGIAMVRRLTVREKEIYKGVLDRMVANGEMSQVDADNLFGAAFFGSEQPGERYLPFVPVKGNDGLFTPLQSGAVIALRDPLTGEILGDDDDVGLAADMNNWGDDEWGLSPIRVIDYELNLFSPRSVKGSNGAQHYEYMPADYGSLLLRFPAHVFKPSGVLQVPDSEKSRFTLSVIPAPEAPLNARFLENGKPVPAEEIEIYSTLGRIQAAS